MKELPLDKIAFYGASVAAVFFLTPLLHKVPRSGGTNILYHVVYIALVVAAVMFLPEWLQEDMFSEGGVLLFSVVIPCYESVMAACTVDAGDDHAWLQFWIIAEAFLLASEFIDLIIEFLGCSGRHWFMFEFFFIFWLMFPLTDGSALIYEKITKPYIAPQATAFKGKMEGIVPVILTLVNGGYIYFAWFIFMSLPEEEKRIIVVALGTVYPAVASLCAVIASDDSASGVNPLKNAIEETFWLTYWVCWTVLFVLMDYLENFIGGVPGFFTLIAVAILYLFLPMFNGATVIFRRVLVPLAGQQEELIHYDAYILKMQLEEQIPAESRERVMAKISDIFGKKKEE